MSQNSRSDSQPDEAQQNVASTESSPVQPSGGVPTLVTRTKLSGRTPLAQNKLVLIAGGAMGLVLVLFVFAVAPSKRLPVQGQRLSSVRQVQSPQSPENEKSLSPVVQSTNPPVTPDAGGRVAEDDIAHTASKRPASTKNFALSGPPQSGSLGAIPPFESSQASWQAPPYQPSGNASVQTVSEPRGDQARSSIVFALKANSIASPKGPSYEPVVLESGPSIGLPVGSRLRARLESAASTAVKAPVIAVVEYNYEKNGEIAVPAGTKALGRIEGADRTGYMSIRFDSLLMPDGSQTQIDAVATDLKLGPIKGKVEGKHTGKNLILRSLSGIGEAGALLVGRTSSSSLDQPFSEGDLIREQISTNIGQSADQTLTGLAVSEHIVVSVFANTPIYLILDRAAKRGTDEPGTLAPSHVTAAASSNSVESLRQLLQLQRELNQSVDTNTH